MKRPILVFYSMLLGCTATYGQQDVTSIYLANPSFEEDAKACTQDSPDALYEGTEGLRGWNLSPKGWQITSPGKASLLTRNVHRQWIRQDGSSQRGFCLLPTFRLGQCKFGNEANHIHPLPAGEYELKFSAKLLPPTMPRPVRLSRSATETEIVGQTDNYLRERKRRYYGNFFMDGKFPEIQVGGGIRHYPIGTNELGQRGKLHCIRPFYADTTAGGQPRSRRTEH